MSKNNNKGAAKNNKGEAKVEAPESAESGVVMSGGGEGEIIEVEAVKADHSRKGCFTALFSALSALGIAQPEGAFVSEENGETFINHNLDSKALIASFRVMLDRELTAEEKDSKARAKARREAAEKAREEKAKAGAETPENFAIVLEAFHKVSPNENGARMINEVADKVVFVAAKKDVELTRESAAYLVRKHPGLVVSAGRTGGVFTREENERRAKKAEEKAA